MMLRIPAKPPYKNNKDYKLSINLTYYQKSLAEKNVRYTLKTLSRDHENDIKYPENHAHPKTTSNKKLEPEKTRTEAAVVANGSLYQTSVVTNNPFRYKTFNLPVDLNSLRLVNAGKVPCNFKVLSLYDLRLKCNPLMLSMVDAPRFYSVPPVSPELSLLSYASINTAPTRGVIQSSASTGPYSSVLPGLQQAMNSPQLAITSTNPVTREQITTYLDTRQLFNPATQAWNLNAFNLIKSINWNYVTDIYYLPTAGLQYGTSYAMPSRLQGSVRVVPLITQGPVMSSQVMPVVNNTQAIPVFTQERVNPSSVLLSVAMDVSLTDNEAPDAPEDRLLLNDVLIPEDLDLNTEVASASRAIAPESSEETTAIEPDEIKSSNDEKANFNSLNSNLSLFNPCHSLASRRGPVVFNPMSQYQTRFDALIDQLYQIEHSNSKHQRALASLINTLIESSHSFWSNPSMSEYRGLRTTCLKAIRDAEKVFTTAPGFWENIVRPCCRAILDCLVWIGKKLGLLASNYQPTWFKATVLPTPAALNDVRNLLMSVDEHETPHDTLLSNIEPELNRISA